MFENNGTPKYRGAAHPLCFTDEVLDHKFPAGFKPVNIEAYDGTTDPGVWIEDYILHIHMARGDDLHAIKYCWGTLQKTKNFPTVSPRSIHEFI